MSHAHHGAHHAQDQGHQTALSLLQQWAHVVANLKLARADTEQNEQHRRQELFHACKQVAKFALQADEDWMLAQNLTLPDIKDQVTQLEEDAFKAHRAAVNRRKEVEGHLAADEVRLRDLGRERDRLKRAWKRVKEGTSTAERQKERHELEGRLLVVRQELGNVMADVQLASDRWHGYRALASVIRQAERGEVVYPPPPLYTAPRSPARQPGGRGRRPPSTIYMEPLVFEDGRPPSSHSHSNEHRRGSVSPLGAPSADWDAPPSGVGHSGRRASHHSTVYTPGAQRTPSDSGDLLSPLEQRRPWDDNNAVSPLSTSPSSRHDPGALRTSHTAPPPASVYDPVPRPHGHGRGPPVLHPGGSSGPGLPGRLERGPRLTLDTHGHGRPVASPSPSPEHELVMQHNALAEPWETLPDSMGFNPDALSPISPQVRPRPRR